MGTSGQCLARTRRQNGSISQNATVRIPARSSPRLKPPMPLNRSRTFIPSRFYRSPSALLVPPAYQPSPAAVPVCVVAAGFPQSNIAGTLRQQLHPHGDVARVCMPFNQSSEPAIARVHDLAVEFSPAPEFGRRPYANVPALAPLRLGDVRHVQACLRGMAGAA